MKISSLGAGSLFWSTSHPVPPPPGTKCPASNPAARANQRPSAAIASPSDFPPTAAPPPTKDSTICPAAIRPCQIGAKSPPRTAQHPPGSFRVHVIMCVFPRILTLPFSGVGGAACPSPRLWRWRGEVCFGRLRPGRCARDCSLLVGLLRWERPPPPPFVRRLVVVYALPCHGLPLLAFSLPGMTV